MAGRSTRKKLRWHADHLVIDQEQFQERLKTMYEMSDARIPELSEAIPHLLEVSNMIIDTCRALAKLL